MDLQANIDALLGDYEPCVTELQTITTVSGNDSVTETYYQTSPDYGYIATAIVFIVVVYSVMRIIGTLLGSLLGGGRR